MKTKFTLLLIGVVGVFLGCSNPNVSLETLKILSFHLDDGTDFNPSHTHYYFDESTSTHYLHGIDFVNPEITFYSFDSLKPAFSVPLGGPKYYNYIRGYYVHSLDSIFLLQSHSNIISLIDTSGQVKKEWVVNDSIEGKRKYYLHATSITPLHYSGGEVISALNVYTPGYHTRPSDYSYNILASLLFNDSSTNMSTFCHIPDIYRRGDILFHYLPSVAVNSRNQTIVSFPVEHAVRVFNEKKELLHVIKAKSEFIDSFQAVEVQKWLKDKAYVDQHNNTYPSYYCIIYDEFRDLYYRVAVPRQQYRIDSGRTRTRFDRDFSVMVLNSDFIILKEFYFSGGYYDYRGIVPVPQGLLISMNNPNNRNFDRRNLKWELFKVNVQ